MYYSMGGQLYSSAGYITPLLVSRGPQFSQKGKVNARKISRRGPYVAPSGIRVQPTVQECLVPLKEQLALIKWL